MRVLSVSPGARAGSSWALMAGTSQGSGQVASPGSAVDMG